MIKPTQLALNIRLQDQATFANFYATGNEILLNYLQDISAGKNDVMTYLWGISGTGRSHLLQASCHAANAKGLSAIYLPLKIVKQSLQILENLEDIFLIALDDIEEVIGQFNWEEAIFNIFNSLLTKRGHLLVSANAPLAALSFVLPDLKSRLASGVVFQVQSLSDRDKLIVLQLRAKARGLYLSEQAGKFLLNTYARDTNSLFAILEDLDVASLAAQRKLTIPFIKQVIKGRYGKI